LSQLVQRIQEPVETAVHLFTARTMISSVPGAVLHQWAMSDSDKTMILQRKQSSCSKHFK